MANDDFLSSDDDWNRPPRGRHLLGHAGMGVLRLTLLFGSGAVALALFLTPIVEEQTRERIARAPFSPGIDLMATGSVLQDGQRSYTIRRSVLQSSPDAVCIISDGGALHGDC